MVRKQTSSKTKKDVSKKQKGAEVAPKETKKSYKSFRLQKRIRHKSGKKLSGSFRLFRDCASFVRQHWKLFGSITFVYFFLSIVLVGLGSSINITELKNNLNESTDGQSSQLGVSLALFTNLIAATNSAPNEGAAAYRTIFTIIVSLAVIWALRQLMGGQRVSLRDSFYKGVYPLIPATLVLLVIGLQLLPLTIGSFLFNLMVIGGLAATLAEQFLWVVLIFLLIVLSLYLITSSIFAFYIVTLPDMRPMRALRAARELVRHRRWTIMRKLLFLPLAMLIILTVVTLPIILIWAPLAPWIFLFLSLGALVFTHVYMYSLYKELI